MPIERVLPDIMEALTEDTRLVLAAPPGAGKTTRVPLELLKAPWMNGQKIILLEPRRIAARMAARRMAGTLGERLGETVGLRTRLETKVSAKTRLEVVTDGVFTRMALSDPGLDGIGAVVFDETHERALTADLGLALALDIQGALRDDLRILAMSATLDTARMGAALKAKVILSEGRSFTVETIYLGRNRDERVEDATAKAVQRALREQSGSILCFLPGQGEIERTKERLERLQGDVILAPLYGALDARAQDLAVSPALEGKRKVVLATDIAESALTIEGVTVVIDAGLARVPETDPSTGVSRLVTRRAARANVDQRRGRAGRTAPGVCYRLWHEEETRGLTPEPTPEILSSDLSGLVLDLASWGETDPSRLTWIDRPPPGRLEAARGQLRSLELIDAHGAITSLGQEAARLPLPPRLASLIARQSGETRQIAAGIAVVLSERGVGGNSTDLIERLQRFRSGTGPMDRRAQSLSAKWAGKNANRASPPSAEIVAGILVGAWPERLAKARSTEDKPGQFLMASGQAARLDPEDALSRKDWLVVAELGGGSGDARIRAAVPVSASIARKQAEIEDFGSFSIKTGRIEARRRERVGAIVISETPLPSPDVETLQRGWVQAFDTHGFEIFPDTRVLDQLLARLKLLRDVFGDPWPDGFAKALQERHEDWLLSLIGERRSLESVIPAELADAAKSLLEWPLTLDLDRLAPRHFETPAGSKLTIDYLDEKSPLVACRVQEVFGVSEQPTIAQGRIPITFSLLSPARRPVALTTDLPGFWTGGYADMRKDMKGRYPKHDWPENPADAGAHRGLTKRRLQS